ncbi:MAG: ribulose-phosphate 3-epimerase [Candidatus Omnitrophota bacterium]
MKKIMIAPSILSCDFSILKDELKKIEDSGADMVHIDVMDGNFVPNITIGPLIVEAIKKNTRLPLDTHLMIANPQKFVPAFIEAGSDIVTIHAEAFAKKTSPSSLTKGMSFSVNEIDEYRLQEALSLIKDKGKKAGVSLNPDSSFCIKGILKDIDMILLMSVHPGFGGQKFIEKVIPKIKEARSLYEGDIQVDGGINDKNVSSAVEAGANIIVAGSYFFSAKDPKEAVNKLRIKTESS